MYDGPWVEGAREGQGKITYPDGSTYVGDFKNNKREGKGDLHYSNGAYYSGDWFNDKKHGQGTFVWAPNEAGKSMQFEGIWSADKSKQGKFTTEDDYVKIIKEEEVNQEDEEVEEEECKDP